MSERGARTVLPQPPGWTTLKVLLAVAALLAACEGPRAAPDAAPPVPDAAPPLRALTARPLLGGSPAENYFLDPQFAASDGGGWIPYSLTSGAQSRITRLHLARTPLGQPVLRLQPGAGRTTAELIGIAKGVSTPMEVAIWLGRSDADMGTFEPNTVVLLGFVAGTGDRAIDLAADPDTPEQSLDGITWRRYVAPMASGPIGFCYFYVSDRTGTPLYLTSPLLVPATAKRAELVRPRRLYPEERAAALAAQRKLQQSLGYLQLHR